jgi:hypothetical protein
MRHAIAEAEAPGALLQLPDKVPARNLVGLSILATDPAAWEHFRANQ